MSRLELDPSYRLLTALVVPRPIAWISTLAADGTGNLAPHSFFNVASHRPPSVLFTSVGRKDTLRNIEETGEFVVNLASAPLLHQVNDSSATWDAGVDEAERVGIATEPSRTVAPPRVVHSPASLECVRHEVVPVGSAYVVIGRVQLITVRPEAMQGDHPAMEHLMPLSRLGRDEWGLPPEVISLRRPD